MRVIACAALLAAACDGPKGPITEPVPPPVFFGCGSEIRSPFDGARGVALDAKVVLAGGAAKPDALDCSNVKFTRDDGVIVRFSAAVDGMGNVLLSPENPLDPDRSYTVDLGAGEPFCGSPDTRATFSTKPGNGIARIRLTKGVQPRWYGSEEVVIGLDVLFSGPILAYADGQVEDAVTVSSGGEPVKIVKHSAGGGLLVEFEEPSDTSNLPQIDRELAVHVSADTLISKGNSIGTAFDVVFVPKDVPGDVKGDGTPVPCQAFDSLGNGGCAAAAGTPLAFVTLLGALAARRRRTRGG